MKELNAVRVEAGEGHEEGEEWCTRGCSYHWRVEVSGCRNNVIILQFDGSCGQAYLSADEAEAIGNALRDHATRIRERSSIDNSVTSATFEVHDCTPVRPRDQVAADAAAYLTRHDA